MIRSPTRFLALIALAFTAVGGDERSFSPIGTIDLGRVLHEAKIYTSRCEEVEKEHIRAKTERARLEQVVSQDLTELKTLKPSDPNAARVKDAVDHDKLSQEQFEQHMKEDLETRQVDALRDSYSIIRDHLR